MLKRVRLLAAISAITVIGALFSISGSSYATGLELSIENQDRRNQIGSMATRWAASVWHDIGGGWELGATLGFDQRGTDVPGYKFLPPVSLRKDGPHNRLVFGVDRLPDWGYGRTAPLVLSSDAPAVPQLHWVVGLGRMNYEKLVGVLDFGEKYLLAHRLTLRPFNTLELTVSEVSVVSEKAASLAVNHLPGWPVYASQHYGLGGLTNDDMNINAAVGGRWDSPWGLIYGDLFVDDMPQKPSHGDAYLIGGQVGYAVPIMAIEWPAVFSVEYTRANNWMYTFRDLPYSYTHQGYVLGHWLGPDSDLFDVALRFPVDPYGPYDSVAARRSVEISYQRIRRGQGKIGDVWEAYGTDYAREHSFLTGVVEKTNFLGVTVDWPLNERLQIGGTVRLGSASNADHVSGKRAFRSEISVEFSSLW